MLTLYTRYTFNPEKIADLRTYFQTSQPVWADCGGRVLGFFAPTDFAGPTNQAIGLIDFENLGAYERYRAALAADARNRQNATRLLASGAGVLTERSIIERI